MAQQKIRLKAIQEFIATRDPVTWVAFNTFASGTIDISVAPFNGFANVTVGDSVLSQSPSADTDCGIFEILTINSGLNTATVALRYDSVAGQKFYSGETVFVSKSLRQYTCYNVYNGVDNASFAVIGVPNIYIDFIPTSEYSTDTYPVLTKSGLGVRYSSFNASSPISSTLGFGYADATSGSFTLTLPSAAGFLSDSGTSYTPTITIKRVDGTGNIVTIAVPSGQYLDGVLNGTTTIGGNLSKLFMSAQPDQWYTVASISAGSVPGGSNQQVQYNNGGAFAGTSAFTYNSGTNLITSTGDINVYGGIQFGNTAQNAIYKGGTDFFIARNYNQDYTIWQVWAPPLANVLTGDREATLALVREDTSGNAEFVDVYNNGYNTGGEVQFGIRCQKRGTGVYRPFVFDWYDGTSPKIEAYRVTDTGITFKLPAGYGVGAGGAVTQITSRTTGVTLDKPSGAITLFSAAGSTTPASFTVTNSTVAATDTIIVNQKSGTDLYQVFVTAVVAGSFNITSFTTGGTTTEQPVFSFAVVKGAVT